MLSLACKSLLWGVASEKKTERKFLSVHEMFCSKLTAFSFTFTSNLPSPPARVDISFCSYICMSEVEFWRGIKSLNHDSLLFEVIFKASVVQCIRRNLLWTGLPLSVSKSNAHRLMILLRGIKFSWNDHSLWKYFFVRNESTHTNRNSGFDLYVPRNIIMLHPYDNFGRNLRELSMELDGNNNDNGQIKLQEWQSEISCSNNSNRSLVNYGNFILEWLTKR